MWGQSLFMSGSPAAVDEAQDELCGESADLVGQQPSERLTAGEKARFLTGDGELSPVLW